ncbi:hypothetical protein E5345_12950 [Propionibacterium sp. NM47_B9-13]|jgi:hypothetical protein|uniref:Uncharacterized protein n=2 Tax=Cutibacterium modestum TaxID=2559073 RepID=A0AAD1NUM5_9ACTN|nr:hypothetical protein [Cutibacterium modestum]TGY27283.1 hypothetical protein E5345_12950 [Propionibacterium sp. NM47_B9-13]AOH45134.1 hypothetical protein BCB70_03580 [Cutibacterium modestum]EFS75227.1 hypothetical protein HMPREF9621_00065 [Cutibacterium modestum HL037PA2]EFS91110.1 hypothetical protein HMPREF9607_02736 [Cutibacterium modestum HL044PA1]EFT16816.1 hypothetical protein HMPREF9622_00087 [Cutibacterium modestum HL037PA3]
MPTDFDPDVVRREISMMHPNDPEYPWPGYSPEVMDGSLPWRMSDSLVAMGWRFDVMTLLNGQPPDLIHAALLADEIHQTDSP